jgi:hypothetical protein
MTSADIKSIVKEEIARATLNESLVSLDYLHDNVSTSTIAGKSWYKLISGLESVINEVKDFNDQFLSSRHGPLPNTRTALIQLQMIVKSLESVKPTIIGMDDIERRDV